MISSATLQSRQPSATTTRSSRTCRQQRRSWKVARASTQLPKGVNRGQSVKFLSRIQPRSQSQMPRLTDPILLLNHLMMRSYQIGWEAGIRTPITWSRATCPTVGRPPSTSRNARTGTFDYSRIEITTGQARRLEPRRRKRRKRSKRIGVSLDCCRSRVSRPHSSFRRPRRSPATRRPAAACGDDLPSRPCGPLRALLRWSTRAPFPSDAPLSRNPTQPCSPPASTGRFKKRK